MITIIAEYQSVAPGLYCDVLKFSNDPDLYYMVDNFDLESGFRYFLFSLEELSKYVAGGCKAPEVTEAGITLGHAFRTEAEYCRWINRNAA